MVVTDDGTPALSDAETITVTVAEVDEVMVRPRVGSVAEGDAGSTVVEVPVTMSEPAAAEVTVDAGTVTFEPGETTQTVPITVHGDTLDEAPLLYGEWGMVAFSNASPNATVAEGFFGLGLFIIGDDDPPPTIVPGAAAVAEGDTGTETLEVPVTLSASSGNTVTVDWATVDSDQPEPGVDYEPASGTVTFLPGETAKTVPITVYGDTVDEPGLFYGAEWGAVAFSSPTNAGFGTGGLATTGLALIVDDD